MKRNRFHGNIHCLVPSAILSIASIGANVMSSMLETTHVQTVQVTRPVHTHCVKLMSGKRMVHLINNPRWANSEGGNDPHFD